MLLAILTAVPLALDGESASNNNSGLAVISIVSIAFGWLLIMGLWWFVFRAKASKGRRQESERERPE